MAQIEILYKKEQHSIWGGRGGSKIYTPSVHLLYLLEYTAHIFQKKEKMQRSGVNSLFT
jgi:hypothetical protein